MRTAILSPHCDDAPFSLGAALLARELGSHPRVHIVFSRSGFARGAHRGESADTVTTVRKAEEQCAARLAGYTPSFWDLPEAFMRPGYDSFGAIFDPAHDPRSDPAWDDLLCRLYQELSDRPDAICVPLGCGNHIDHRILRDAALTCCEAAGLSERLVFYEDLPYAAGLPQIRLDAYVRAVPVAIDPVVLGASFVRGKQALLGCYPSQITPRSVAAVAMHAYRVGGERLWAHPACLPLLKPQTRHNVRGVVSELLP